MTELVEVAKVTGEVPRVVEDETLAVRCAATTVLITAAIAADVKAVARRIHAASVRAGFPFEHVSAAAPTHRCHRVRGSLCPPTRCGQRREPPAHQCRGDVDFRSGVTDRNTCRTAGRARPARRSPPYRRTTVFLHDRIASSTFSERLFYRLNIIHVVVPGCFATRDTLDAETPTRAELQAAFRNDDHISEVPSE